MKKINAMQMRKIYAIGRAAGISVPGDREDDLHLMITGLTGKSSVKELSYTEAITVIERLEELQHAAGVPVKAFRKEKVHPEKPGGVTARQQKKAWALMYELEKYDKGRKSAVLVDRLRAIIKKELGRDGSRTNPFAWMDFSDGNRLIETLKAYLRNEARKAEKTG